MSEYWERRPVLIKRPFPHSIISPKEMFAAVVNAAARQSQGERDAVLAFQIEGEQVKADPRKFLPRPGDQTMSGYADRLARMLRGRRFALIVEEIQMEAPQVWLRFREFLCGLSRVGMVPARVKASVFVGNYKITPAGLHRGNSANFKFVVQGRKKLRLWPDKLFRGKKNLTGTLDVGRFIPAATTLEGHPGDIIYWPSDRWHVAECVGGLAVSVSLAFRLRPRPAAAAAKSVAQPHRSSRQSGFPDHVATCQKRRDNLLSQRLRLYRHRSSRHFEIPQTTEHRTPLPSWATHKTARR